VIAVAQQVRPGTVCSSSIAAPCGADAFGCRGLLKDQRTDRDSGHDAAGMDVDRQ
jgi:hypothetical protein